MEWAIYFVGLADSLQAAAVIIAIVSGTVAVIAGAVWAIGRVEHEDSAVMLGLRITKATIVIFSVALLFAVFTPSSRTLAAMIILPRLAENEQVQNITGNSLKALEKLTAEWAAETVLDVKGEEATP